MARKVDPAKRTAILHSARLIFLKDGFAATKMSDIASESGVAPGTLYLYFDSKEALANAIGEDFFARLSDAFAEAAKKIDRVGSVGVLVDWAAKIGTEERDLFLLCKHGLPQSAQDETGPRLAFRNRLAEVLKRLQSKEYARQYDASDLADVVMGILHSVIMACICEQNKQPDRVKSAATKLLQHALFEDEALVAKPARGPSSANQARS